MLGAGPRSGAPGHQFAPRRPLDPGCPAAALRGRGTARRWLECPGKGRLAQRESACFTRKRSLVRNQRRPPKVTGAPSSSGPGRSPLKAEIAGSNPAGATRTQVRQLKLARCPGQAASLVLAGAEGVRPPADEIGKVAASVQQLEPAGLSTLHNDLVGGKQMELEALHGFVVRRAAHHRPGAPMSETVYALLRPHALRRRQVAAFARTLRARCPGNGARPKTTIFTVLLRCPSFSPRSLQLRSALLESGSPAPPERNGRGEAGQRPGRTPPRSSRRAMGPSARWSS